MRSCEPADVRLGHHLADRFFPHRAHGQGTVLADRELHLRPHLGRVRDHRHAYHPVVIAPHDVSAFQFLPQLRKLPARLKRDNPASNELPRNRTGRKFAPRFGADRFGGAGTGVNA